MPRKLGDLPTMRLDAARVAEYAKHADARARAGRPASAPDIQISVEYLEEAPTAVRRSEVLPAARSIEDASLEAVPVIVVNKDDLAWFEFEAETHALLAVIDGRTSVAELLPLVALPAERAVAVLRDLELQRVIAFA